MEYKGRAQEDERLVYGKNPVAELLKSGSGVDTVFLADTLPPAVAGYYMALAKEAGAVAKQVRAAKLRSICGVDSHQGVAAFAASVEYATLDDLLQRAADQQHAPFLVLADGVEDPHNLGAIIRSALLCGADGVVIPKRGGAAITPTVMKASAGAAAEGAERLCLLRRYGRRASVQKQPHRPHCPGHGQRGQRCVGPGEKAVRRGDQPAHGRPGHRCGQLQRVGGGGDHPLRDPAPAPGRLSPDIK